VVELGCRFQVPSATERNGASNAGMESAIEGLLEQLNTNGVDADERRVHPRAAYTARIVVEIGPDQPPVIGFGRDLSHGGISFLTSTPLPLERVTLTLPQQDRPTLRLRAHIVRCHQLRSGVYDVGANFLAIAPSRDRPEAETVAVS
jgi:hypothetical protein